MNINDDEKELLPVGSVVEIQLLDMSIISCIITQHSPILTMRDGSRRYDYRGIHFKSGYMGVNTYFTFDEQYIVGVVYNSYFDSMFTPYTGQIHVSGMIIKDNIKYLVIGDYQNILYCLTVSENDSFNVTKIAKDEKFDIYTQGIAGHDNSEENRKHVLLNVENLLPIGTYVMMKLGEDEVETEVMIVGRCIEDETGALYNYVGVDAFLGLKDQQKLIYFDPEHIFDVLKVGYFNESEYVLRSELDEFLREAGDEDE